MAIGGAFRNQADLITETLANLGVLAAGQATDPEDTNYVLSIYDAILRKLAALEIAYIPDPNNVPAEYFKDLSDILAGECCTKFGSSPEDAATLKGQGLGNPPGTGVAARSLKQITRGRPTYERQRVEYF
jgi:hypothetical protein